MHGFPLGGFLLTRTNYVAAEVAASSPMPAKRYAVEIDPLEVFDLRKVMHLRRIQIWIGVELRHLGCVQIKRVAAARNGYFYAPRGCCEFVSTHSSKGTPD